jgi:hypothetical protein
MSAAKQPWERRRPAGELLIPIAPAIHSPAFSIDGRRMRNHFAFQKSIRANSCNSRQIHLRSSAFICGLTPPQNKKLPNEPILHFALTVAIQRLKQKCGNLPRKNEPILNPQLGFCHPSMGVQVATVERGIFCLGTSILEP